MLRMLDLFSGIGGFSYAGEKLVGGYETVAFCEYDKHAQKVLRKHWPDTEIIDDVRELANDADRFRGMVDVITGGYPCQPFSLAGVRRGDKDDRHLWPEMLRIIQAVRPTWVIGENVAGHITLGLDTVLSDLEAAGYTSRCYVIPAVAADAPHRRDRVWIVAHSDDRHRPRKIEAVLDQSDGQASNRPSGGSKNMADTDSAHQQRGRVPSGTQSQHAQPNSRGNKSGWQAPQFWEPEPTVGRVANGVSGRIHRLKQLGNSIVPQVAARILYAIREAHEQT